jgi:hypothetical protein
MYLRSSTIENILTRVISEYLNYLNDYLVKERNLYGLADGGTVESVA